MLKLSYIATLYHRSRSCCGLVHVSRFAFEIHRPFFQHDFFHLSLLIQPFHVLNGWNISEAYDLPTFLRTLVISHRILCKTIVLGNNESPYQPSQLFHKILVAADAPRMKLLFVLLHSVLEAYLIANEDLEL
jgi:hypothetical protein